MPDPLIASAFVRIKPEPKSVSGFGKGVRATIEKSFTRPVRIKVEPRLLPFKSKIQKELNSAVFTVKVTPVLAPGFKSQVSKLAKTAAAGVSIPVTPAPAGRAAASKPTATGTAQRGPAASSAASRQEAFLKRLKTLTDSQTLAQRTLTKAEQASGTVKERKAAINKAVTQTQTALNRVEAEELKLAGTLTQKQAARLATAQRRAKVAVDEALALKANLQATIQNQAAQASANATTKISTDLETRRLAIRKQLAAADQAGALATTKVSAARTVLSAKTAALSAAEALNRDALKTTDLRLQRLTGALLRRAAADELAAKAAVKTAIADERASTAAAHRTAKEAQLAKGLFATALAGLGARGATLAASFEFLAGAAIATGLFKSIQLAAKLEEELNVFRVTAEASADEMERVGLEARKLGADITLPGVSANDAATAMTELAKAGLSVEDSMGAARGALQLATAAQLSNEEAVNLTASALNAFGLAGTQATHVADLLAGAARESQGGIEAMGQALSSVSSVARQAGISVEDTIALLTLLTKNGIQGAESGTALRVALLRLIAPTKKARDELEKLNIRVLNGLGNVRPEVFADIARETDKLRASERNMALQTIFGTRAIRAQAVLGREGAAGLDEMRASTDKIGLAAADAAARTQGFSGQVEALKNSMSTLGETLGKGLIPLFGGFVDTGIEVVGVLQDINTELKNLDERSGANEDDGFFAGLKDVLGTSGGDVIKDIRATQELLSKRPAGETFSFGNTKALIPGLGGAVDEINKVNAAIAPAIDNADALALALNSLGTGTSGPVGAQVDFLRELRSQILGSGEEAVRLKERIDAVIALLTHLGRAPTALELKIFFEKGGVDRELLDVQRRVNQARINIEMGLDKKSVVFLGASAGQAAEVAAKDAEERFRIFFGEAMVSDPLLRSMWDPFFLPSIDAAEDAAGKAAATFAEGFESKIAVATAKGASSSVILGLRQQELAKRKAFFSRIDEEIETGKRPKTKANLALREQAAKNVTATESEIQSIISEQESASKAAADKISKAKSDADQKFLDALGLGRGRIENKILLAEGSAGVDDDIKTHTELRNFFKRKIQEASKTIKDAQTKAETIQSLTADLITENQKLKELNSQLISSLAERFEARIDIQSVIGTVGSIRKLYGAWIDALQKALAEATKGSKLAQDLKQAILQTQKAAFTAINEGFELDIEIAQAQERPAAEIKARERFIAQLKREQDQYRRGSLEWKRLQLEIINQEKAIKEASGALDDMNDATASMQFKFLQTQTGFAANLLGNLIPGGVGLGSLVGGTTPSSASAAAGAVNPFGPPLGTGRGPDGGPVVPRSGPAQAVSAQGATVAGTPTRVGQTKEIQLLKEILTVLRSIYRGSGHPEAKHAQKTGGGSGGGSDMIGGV